MGADFTLSDQQWAAVSAPMRPAVVIAGAGSGKTSLMAARVVYLVANGLVRPDEVLGLTFTTKAAAELRARIRTSLTDAGFGRGATLHDQAPDGTLAAGEEAEVLEPTVATYNAYAAGLLTEHGLRIGHEPDTRVMADASRYQLAARAVGRHTGAVTLLSDSPAHVISWILQLEAAMSEHLVGVDDVREIDRLFAARVDEALRSGAKGELPRFADALAKREELLGLVEGYRELKHELGLMDFSDQIALSARLAEEHPDVGREERAKYRIVLLDEYQDTSVAQARLLSSLFSGPPGEGRGHAVTAVGDPNQAIYGWRGASVSNIVHFADDFPAASGEVPTHPLTVNRRSDARILETANRLAAPLLERYPVVRPLEPAGAAPGEVRTIVHETYAGELEWLAAHVLETHERLLRSESSRPAHARRIGLWREIGVLVRDNRHAADVFDALTAAGVPVEIVGLQGLLRLPEVSEVVATLTLLDDLTANAELLQLLSGPRWAIGPRDLALLGRRARELAATQPGGGRERPADVAEELRRAVAGADPTEVVALSDALDDPGELPYSPEARERFALLAQELRHLRAHVAEPLLELVRRIIETCGIDVELASSVSETGRARRDNLDLFVKAVAEFEAIDGSVTLPALLSYLTAEDELGGGLDVATPSEADSVKLLTVHRAKGLEWDVVFLPGMCEDKFPHSTLRNQWPTSAHVLPIPLRGDVADLPALPEVSADGLKAFRERARDHQQEEELRLGYVALTRPRHLLWVSSYCWTEQRKTPLGPSPYQQTVRDAMAAWEVLPDAWIDRPAKGQPNPAVVPGEAVSWPVTTQTAEALRRIDAAERVWAADPDEPDADLDLVEQAHVAQWDDELERLLVEAREGTQDVLEVPLPSSLSATGLARLRDDPDAFVADLVRPMPRQPSPAARFGTRFHAWVEARFGQQQLLDPDELPGRGDAGIEDDADLRDLIALFEKGPFADRGPHRIEAPFALVVAGQVVRGRIDAVYAEPDGRWLVVDWKTNRDQTADPLQLAIYRLAWSELAGVPLEDVDAAFHYVRTGETVRPTDLPDRVGIASILAPEQSEP
ncbi:ATP-dependent helicase [Nocardioides pocheonensis]|uniref:DNA 3'-5' helicase n=2 Tax=Nocardioides pocheonensis TaxID=661485 RepID=A0A3N0GZL8_9ACTN|nr:ATP-dependent helicase [Nocardioides pocheonensis]